MRIRTCLAENAAFPLWHRFKSRRLEIAGKVNANYFSVQVFDAVPEFHQFTPDTRFDKWAAVEVGNFENLPEGMEPYTLPGGAYAVYTYRGTMEVFQASARYFFGAWLPQSGYQLDDRPHFEVMDDRYKGPNDPGSEEEVWVPVKKAELN